MRFRLSFVAAGLALSVVSAAAQDADSRAVVRKTMKRVVARAYQGRNTGPEETERFSGKYTIGRDGRVSVSNIAGDITVTGRSGNEVSVEAIKRTHGDRSQLASVRIDVENGPARVDVQTRHTGRNDRVSVDYTVTVPSAASVEVHSVSGSLKVTGVGGVVRAETVSGTVTATDTPKLEIAKSVSGNVSLSGVSVDGDLSAASVSGNVNAKGVKVRGLDLGSVSGDVVVTDVTCDRLNVRSISGGVEYAGGISRNGRYDINAHSGTVRLTLANPAGFELNASTFSGSIRSDFALTIGGDSDRRAGRPTGVSNRSIRATYGDGSATLSIRTFSGDIVIAKR